MCSHLGTREIRTIINALEITIYGNKKILPYIRLHRFIVLIAVHLNIYTILLAVMKQCEGLVWLAQGYFKETFNNIQLNKKLVV